MRKQIALGVIALVVSSVLAACGSSAPATSSVAAPATAPPSNAAPSSATGKMATPTEDETPAGSPPAKATGNEPTEEKLRATKALEGAFPTIDEVTKEIGAPFANGKATRRAWWFEKRPLGKTFSCSTIDVIRGPSGRVILDVSVNTSDECKKVPVTKAQVVDVLATLSGEPAPADPVLQLMAEDAQRKTFDETSAVFEKKLGKPRETGEPDFAAWRYVDDAGACRVLFVTSYLGSRAGQAIWGLPCT